VRLWRGEVFALVFVFVFVFDAMVDDEFEMSG
jgi:hypothetical protein